MDVGYTIRKATVAEADIALMVAHRIGMFRDMGRGDDASRSAAGERFAQWVRPRIEAGVYHAWFIELAEAPVGGAACWVRERQPGVGAGPRDEVAYVLNVFIEPAQRSRGLARRLMEHIVAWARAEGFDTVELHASDQGRPLYESMGFRSRPEMMSLKLR